MTNPTVRLEASIGAPATAWFTLDDPTAGLLNTGALAADYSSTGFYASLTSRAYSISTSRGRQRLLERAQAGTLAADLDNSDRALDPTNTSSEFYSNGQSLVQPMRNVRLSATWGYERALTGGTTADYISTPHNADLALTDICIVWKGSCLWQSAATDVTLASKWGTAGNRSWRLQCRGGGDIRFSWSSNGTNTNNILFSSFAPQDNRIYILSLYFIAATGTAELLMWDQSGTANELDDSAAAGATTLYNATSTPITMGVDGAGNDNGSVTVHYCRIHTHGRPFATASAPIASAQFGRCVAAFDASWVQPGDTSVVSYPTGETWTFNGSVSVGGTVRYPLWQGYSDDWVISWQDPAMSQVTLTATDGFKSLARVDNDATGAVGAGEATGARIGRLLDAAAWPTAQRDLDTGQTTVQATTLAQNALTEVYLTADTELGNVFMGPTNKVTFRDRHARLTDMRSKQPWWIFGDVGTDAEIPYADLVISTNDDLVYNDISIARVGGSAQTTNDSTSIEAHLTRTFTRTDLIMQTDAVAASYASYVLASQKDADVRFDALTIDGTGTDDRVWPVILGVEIGDRVTVRRRPPGGGSMIERDCYVEGISHEIRPPTVWRTTLQLSDASHQLGFVLDDSELGVLNTSALTF